MAMIEKYTYHEKDIPKHVSLYRASELCYQQKQMALVSSCHGVGKHSAVIENFLLNRFQNDYYYADERIPVTTNNDRGVSYSLCSFIGLYFDGEKYTIHSTNWYANQMFFLMFGNSLGITCLEFEAEDNCYGFSKVLDMIDLYRGERYCILESCCKYGCVLPWKFDVTHKGICIKWLFFDYDKPNANELYGRLMPFLKYYPDAERTFDGMYCMGLELPNAEAFDNLLCLL